MAKTDTILVVDDSLVNRKILLNLLKGKYNVLEAGTGQQAMQLLKKFANDMVLVLLDLTLPDMDGYQFLYLKEADSFLRSIPVIVTAEKLTAEEEMAVLKAGALDMQTKPFHPKRLTRKIDNLATMRRAMALLSEIEKDKVTGLSTKEFFSSQVRKVFKENPGKDYDLIVNDIANFKLINDIFGEATGDRVLRYLANLVLNNTPGLVACGRLRADNFGMLVERGKIRGESYYEEINKRLNSYNINSVMNVQFGIYSIDDKNMDVNSMCDRALMAIKPIKDKYGCRVAHYDDEARRILLLEQELARDMEKALANREFIVYVQPKYDIITHAICGAEALVRWQHPVKGFMGPGAFVPYFERNGFVSRLDYYVWEEACRFVAEMEKLGYSLPVSTNVSRVDLYEPELAQKIRGLVEKYAIDPKLLHLEITESAYTEDPDAIIRNVQKLKDAGFTIEMDDFGTGYSSLASLGKLPIDILKVDRSLVVDGAESAEGRRVLDCVIQLSRIMELVTVAEGIETKEQEQILADTGCNIGQGYLFAKPMPMERFLELLQEEKKD